MTINNKVFYNIFIISLYVVMIIYTVVAFLPPFLLHFAVLPDLTETIYRFYHNFCHQLPQRSFFILGNKMALCARCTGINLGIILTLFIPFPFRSKPIIKWSVIIALLIPLIIDGMCQLFACWQSTNISRIITGILYGYSTFIIIRIIAFNLIVEEKWKW